MLVIELNSPYRIGCVSNVHLQAIPPGPPSYDVAFEDDTTGSQIKAADLLELGKVEEKIVRTMRDNPTAYITFDWARGRAKMVCDGQITAIPSPRFQKLLTVMGRGKTPYDTIDFYYVKPHASIVA